MNGHEHTHSFSHRFKIKTVSNLNSWHTSAPKEELFPRPSTFAFVLASYLITFSTFLIQEIIFNEILKLFWKNNLMPTYLMRLSKKIGRTIYFEIKANFL